MGGYMLWGQYIASFGFPFLVALLIYFMPIILMLSAFWLWYKYGG